MVGCPGNRELNFVHIVIKIHAFLVTLQHSNTIKTLKVINLVAPALQQRVFAFYIKVTKEYYHEAISEAEIRDRFEDVEHWSNPGNGPGALYWCLLNCVILPGDPQDPLRVPTPFYIALERIRLFSPKHEGRIFKSGPNYR